jgi:hypothetical protein
MLQSGTKEVDLVLDRWRGLYKTVESVIDLSGRLLTFSESTDPSNFRDLPYQRQSENVPSRGKEKDPFQSSVGNLSISD